MADFTNLLGDAIENEDVQEEGILPVNYPEEDVVEETLASVRVDAQDYEEVAEVGNGVEDPEYKMLKDLWIQELCCPEILPYDHDTLSMHMELLEVQEEAVEKLMSNEHPSTDAEGNSIDPILTSFEATIYRMDMERVKFIMEDLARVRCRKIEEHPFYMPTMVDRLSEEEESFMNSYNDLVKRHLRRTVLDEIKKAAFQKLDDPEMIDSPDLNEYVFCRIKESVVINVRVNGENDDEGPQDYAAGACLVAKYNLIKNLILEGKVELML